MNLKKVFKEELWSSLIMFLVFGYSVWNKESVSNSILVGFIFIIMIWAIYYFIFTRLKKDFKLDERELFIYTKIGYTSIFVFLTFLTIIYVIQDISIPLLNKSVITIWGRFILPVFVLVHSITGFIYCRIDEKETSKQKPV